jgi:hypothetical protein
MSANMSANTPERQAAWRSVVAKAWSDDSFKQKLIDDPNTVLASSGVDVPQGLNIVVVENEPDRVHLVLPARPDSDVSVKGMPLTESDYDPGF